LRFLAKVLNTKDFFQNSQFDQIHYLRPSSLFSFPSATPDWAESAMARVSTNQRASNGKGESSAQVERVELCTKAQYKFGNVGGKNLAIAMLSDDVGGLKRTT